MLKHDNSVLREKGWETWSKLQDERHTGGFTYAENAVDSNCFDNNPQSDAVGDRGEWDMDVSGGGKQKEKI